MPDLLEFVDPDSGSNCLVLVRRTDESIGLAFNVVGETDFEIFIPLPVAAKLSELISAAANPPGLV